MRARDGVGLRRALLGEVAHDRRHLVRSAPCDADLEAALLVEVSMDTSRLWSPPVSIATDAADTTAAGCGSGQDVADRPTDQGLDGSRQKIGMLAPDVEAQAAWRQPDHQVLGIASTSARCLRSLWR